MVVKFFACLCFFFLEACSCNVKRTTMDSFAGNEKEDFLVENKLNQEIIQTLLDLPEWQWVYHSEIKERLPVKLLKSDKVSDSLKLKKYGQPVAILSKKILDSLQTKAYVHLKELKFFGDTVYFYLEYPAEGAVANGRIIKMNKRWVADKYSVTEQ
jgi:hypothetical protein